MPINPKTLIDSIADGVIEVAEGPVRVANNLARVAESFSASVKTNMDEVKAKMPDDPMVIPRVIIRGIGQTGHTGIDAVQALTNALNETAEGVKSQIRRGTGG